MIFLENSDVFVKEEWR